MSFTVSDMKPYVAAQAHKNVRAAAGSTSDNDVERWILRAIRFAQRHDFECWRAEFQLDLTAGTYLYPYSSAVWNGSALTRPLRLDGSDEGVGYGSSQYLKWVATIKRMDEVLGGHSWKRDTTKRGTPNYFSEMQQSLVIGVPPSQDFIDTNPSLYGYYYRGEDLSTSGFEDVALAAYDDFFEHLVNLSLVFATQQEDDTEFNTLLQYWLQHDLVEMRGYDHVSSDDEPIPAPPFATYVEGSDHTW